jgi:hypothetical protein
MRSLRGFPANLTWLTIKAADKASATLMTTASMRSTWRRLSLMSTMACRRQQWHVDLKNGVLPFSRHCKHVGVDINEGVSIYVDVNNKGASTMACHRQKGRVNNGVLTSTTAC